MSFRGTLELAVKRFDEAEFGVIVTSEAEWRSEERLIGNG